MHKYLIIVLALCSLVLLGHARDAIPTIQILPEDVVQDSIGRYYIGGNTNNVMVLWKYTEAGAKKMLAFRIAHDGQEVITRVGDFEFRGMIEPRKSYPAGWVDDDGWLKTRTDKFYSVSEADAKMIIAGLKSK
jgi:hypothetical protein